MQVEYNILTIIRFRHAYFSDLQLKCFSVQPSAKTQKHMLDNGLVFKSFADSFTLLHEKATDQTLPTTKIFNNQLTLRFLIFLLDNNFFNYTGCSIQNLKESIFYFHNNTNSYNKLLSTECLHLNEFVSNSDIVSFKQFEGVSFKKPFAVLDLSLKENISPDYTIIFEELQTYWRYILISEHLQNLQKPAILNEHEAFSGPFKTELPNKRKALYFVSNTPIGLKQSYKKFYKLVENYDPPNSGYKVVKRILPVPNPTVISTFDRTNKNKIYSDIFIY